MSRPVARTSPDALDPSTFGTWMSAIADRIGRTLEDDTLGMYYAELAQRLDTAAFVRAARAVFSRPLFAQWPGWEEFVEAASPQAEYLTPPNVAATAALLNAHDAIPRPSDAALAAFADPTCGWRAALRAPAPTLPAAPCTRPALPPPDPAAEAELAAIAAHNQARRAATMEPA